jgi:hypothetical protein
MPISKTAVDFISGLSSDELEIFCGLDLGKSDHALSLRLTALLHMIDRLDTGKQKTAVDRLKADKLRDTASTIIKENPFLLSSHQYLDLLATTKRKRFFTSDWIYTFSVYLTRLRLLGTRGNRIATKSARFLNNSLGKLFSVIGIFGGLFELSGDLTVSITSAFKKLINLKTGEQLLRWQQFKVSFLAPHEQLDALAEERIKHEQYLKNKWPRWTRFKNTFWKGNRFVRMLNALAVPVVNATLLLFPLAANATFKFIFILFPATAIASLTAQIVNVVLNIGITVLDIFLDGGSAFYAYYQHLSLSKKLNKVNNNQKIIDSTTLNNAETNLSKKQTETLITRLLRLNSSNLTMCIAMVLIQTSITALTPLITPYIALFLLGAAFLVALTDLKHFALTSKFEKVRSVLVLALIATAIVCTILLMTMPPLALGFTIPFFGATTLSLSLIGSALAFTVGTLGFIRAIVFRDPNWTAEKKNIVKENFHQALSQSIKVPFATPTLQKSPAPAHAGAPAAGMNSAKRLPSSTTTKKMKEHLTGQKSFDMSDLVTPRREPTLRPQEGLGVSLPERRLPLSLSKIHPLSQTYENTSGQFELGRDEVADLPAPKAGSFEELEEMVRLNKPFSPAQSPAIDIKGKKIASPPSSPPQQSRSYDENISIFRRITNNITPREPHRPRAASTSPRKQSIHSPAANTQHR